MGLKSFGWGMEEDSMRDEGPPQGLDPLGFTWSPAALESEALLRRRSPVRGGALQPARPVSGRQTLYLQRCGLVWPMSSAGEFRHLVRIAGKDLEGSKKLAVALSDIKGVGHDFSNSVIASLGLDPRLRLGTLTEEQVAKVEEALHRSAKSGLPMWYYNRRKDPETGETQQLLSSDLDFAMKNDIDRERNVQSWRGIRHGLGLKVRGQRTRTTGRKGRTVGVRKAALQAAAKEAAAKEEK